MSTKEISKGSVEKALAFIESVKGHLIEINNNPELLRRLNESSGFSYSIIQEKKLQRRNMF